MSTLYIVATPIGNLEDITLRALEILKSVDVIVCEDTRITQKLLLKYGVKKPFKSYHQQSALARIDEVLGILAKGGNIAYVSDAGTPGISDPGGLLVQKTYERFEDDVHIVAVPGANAAIAGLSISGFPTDRFIFLGFPPHKKGRSTFFKTVSGFSETVVFYESKHRILKTLNELSKVVGDRSVVVIRELTKQLETIYRGTAEECAQKLQKDKVLGEFVVVVRAKKK